MEHRLLEKTAVLKQLENMIAINSASQQKEKDAQKLEELKKFELKWRADLEMINGINDEEILVNREILLPYRVNYWPVC